MLLQEIRAKLKKLADTEFQKSYMRFFKQGEEIRLIGVRIPAARKIAGEYFRKIKDRSKKTIFALCEKLLQSGMQEEIFIAFDWAHRLEKRYKSSDFAVFKRWLAKYVSNWATCDDLCTHALGAFIYKFPEKIPELKRLANSRNRWLRRASAVSLIYTIRRKNMLEDVFAIVDMLLLDADDLVQKAYGWLLKEASNKYPKEIFDFLDARKDEMPKTALRYATEKLSPELRKRLMKKS